MVTFKYVYIIIILITVPFWSTKISPSHLLVYYPYIIKVPYTLLPIKYTLPATHTPPAPFVVVFVCLCYIVYKYEDISGSLIDDKTAFGSLLKLPRTQCAWG